MRFLFLYRLCSFITNGSKQTGFIPDILRILQKYNLYDIFESYKKESVFPNKVLWKKLVKQKIKERETYLWHTRISQPEFSRFRLVHCNFKIHHFWHISKQRPRFLKACKSVMQMISFITDESYNSKLCCKCYNRYYNSIDHCIGECAFLRNERALLWDRIYHFNSNVYLYLRGLDKTSLVSLLLGGESPDLDLLLGENKYMFWCLCFSCMHVMWVKYNSQLKGYFFSTV